jgi:hypothetical protein
MMINSFQIVTENKSLYQRQIINLPIENISKRVVFELRYLYATDKWYFSFFDAQSGNPLCTYVPLVASYEYMDNLLEPFTHKRIGWLVCFPVVDEPTSVNPTKNNLAEFAIVWGDTLDG